MIIIGSDHAGIELKKKIIEYLYTQKIEYADVTCYANQDGDDYPDVARVISQKVLENKSNLGIAICGTGIGISICCNKFRGIRAALCTDEYMAKLSRLHNNANILCLGARLENAKNDNAIKQIVQAFINNFYEGGRHDRRLEKIRDLENLNLKGDK